ncbi:uncharacterized protein LOC126895749 [Daktulosphaira vitifoliae]|uniref:uncharacterized protein LOC126895749 n=1 Tax=Daktulosphaira vitifoliae TaxID=58002 RepID=UPI0021A9D674|nr:uncharacterized protein LOC126895749 [Daktulosphaira vitifoliae]
MKIIYIIVLIMSANMLSASIEIKELTPVKMLFNCFFNWKIHKPVKRDNSNQFTEEFLNELKNWDNSMKDRGITHEDLGKIIGQAVTEKVCPNVNVKDCPGIVQACCYYYVKDVRYDIKPVHIKTMDRLHDNLIEYKNNRHISNDMKRLLSIY